VKRWALLLNHLACALLGLSGIAYGVMKYFVAAADPDSRVGHPWQQPMLKLHVLTAPFLVFALGLVFSGHALKRLQEGEDPGRTSGAGLLFLAAPLVLTGPLIQAFTGDAARQWAGWIHAALGAVYVLAYVAHLLKKRPPVEDSPG
jgi:membrane protein YdbS with pleckstrin-like domain